MLQCAPSAPERTPQIEDMSARDGACHRVGRGADRGTDQWRDPGHGRDYRSTTSTNQATGHRPVVRPVAASSQSNRRCRQTTQAVTRRRIAVTPDSV